MNQRPLNCPILNHCFASGIKSVWESEVFSSFYLLNGFIVTVWRVIAVQSWHHWGATGHDPPNQTVPSASLWSLPLTGLLLVSNNSFLQRSDQAIFIPTDHAPFTATDEIQALPDVSALRASLWSSLPVDRELRRGEKPSLVRALLGSAVRRAALGATHGLVG